MRIAYLNTNYQQNHTGGGFVHMEQFIRNAVALGHEIWVFRGDKLPGVNIIPSNRIKRIKALRSMDALYIRLENKSPQICAWSTPPLRTLYGFPLVVWEFNTLPDEIDDQVNPALVRPTILKKYSPGCDLAVCVSPALATIVNEKLNAKKVIVISNGSDPGLFTPEAPIVERMKPFEGKFNVVWIGTVKESWHDLEMIRDAARILWQQAPDICFHIIGSGLSGFMADTPPNLYYWGAEQYSRLPEWLAVMDVGLSIYKPGKSYYNSPLKLFDYMSSGLAAISTEHPLAREIFNQLDQSELIIPHGDANALSRAVISLAGDRARVKQLGEAGRQLVIEKFNWRASVCETMNVMEDILREKKNSLTQ
jgi:glycosyltransferase involved in cell wall biosynthesis